MAFIKYISLMVLIIIFGEIVFRFDELHRGSNEILEELNIEQNSSDVESCDHNIFLLGDSYTAGQGIPKGERISDVISFEDYCLINLSKGGDDWIDYYHKYLEMRSQFKKGDIVVIGINWNDILYNEHEYTVKDNSQTTSNFSESKLTSYTKPNKPWYRRIYSNSKLANTLSSNIQNTLKRHNLALPIGDFYYLEKIGYLEKKMQLDKLISQIDSLNSIYEIRSVFYLMPEYNLLDNKGYFKEYIEYYVSKKLPTITIINGFDDFKGRNGQDYMLSIHDGHPNSQAHAIIAKSLENIFNSSKSNQNHQGSN
jgi:hypothetical protein